MTLVMLLTSVGRARVGKETPGHRSAIIQECLIPAGKIDPRGHGEVGCETVNSELHSQSLRRKLTMAEYILRRNGVPMGAPGSLRNMLHRSLGARSFAVFWQYWNPVFGYTLGRYVFSPSKRVLPPPVALVFTFVVCGALHDLVTTLVRGSPAFLFTPWFFFLALGVLAGRRAALDLGRFPWSVRASANLAYVTTCLGLALVARSSWNAWVY